MSVAWNDDGLQLASASDDKVVIIWTVHTGEKHAVLSFSIPAVQDMMKCTWSSNTVTNTAGHMTSTLTGHSESVNSVAWSPKGSEILSGSDDMTAIIWNVVTGDVVSVLRGHTSTVLSVAWSPDGAHVVTGSADATAIVWNVASLEIVCVLRGHTGQVKSVAWSQNSNQIVTSSVDQKVIIWNAFSGNILAALPAHFRV
jgi:WD40 repeat protein